MFGLGRPRALARSAKVRIMHWARCLSCRSEKGRAYGVVTAKALAVLEALLWAFHNARSGLCFPLLREDRRSRPLRPLEPVAEAIRALALACFAKAGGKPCMPQALRWSSDYPLVTPTDRMRTPRQPPPQPESAAQKRRPPTGGLQGCEGRAKPQAKAEIRSFLVRR
jgi:hypothetical protein